MTIAIVTGASSGLGREYAKLLDEENVGGNLAHQPSRTDLTKNSRATEDKVQDSATGPDPAVIIQPLCRCSPRTPSCCFLLYPCCRLWPHGKHRCHVRKGYSRYDSHPLPCCCIPYDSSPSVLPERQSYRGNLFLRCLSATALSGGICCL